MDRSKPPKLSNRVGLILRLPGNTLAELYKTMLDTMPSGYVFAGPLDILVEDGYITQTSDFDDVSDTRIYQDICAVCEVVIWEYVGQYHDKLPGAISSWFSPNSPKYYVASKSAEHFARYHGDIMTLAIMKASST